MLTLSKRVALVVSCICLGATFFFYEPTPGSGWRGIDGTINFIGLLVELVIVFAISFSLFFTATLGVLLIKNFKTASPPKKQKALNTFYLSLFPFVPSLWFFLHILLLRVH